MSLRYAGRVFELAHGRFRAASLVLGCCLLSAMSGAFVVGCDRDKPAKPPVEDKKPDKPTLRLFALGGAAGAIEPCGCVKDMLGGIDHAAAFIASSNDEAVHSLVVGAGPMFFADPHVEESKREQALFKAEAMASSLHDLGLLAWAPGANDWALGTEQFGKLARVTGAKVLAANLPAEAGPVEAMAVIERGGLKIGLLGVSVPDAPTQKLDFVVSDASEVARSSVKKLQAAGADILVALISAQRGQALRLIERLPELQLAVVGKGFDQGEANDGPYAPEVIDKTLVTQAPNHLQSVAVVDLFVRDGSYSFQDASGLESREQRASLEGRIQELDKRIASWKKPDSGAKKSDIEDREKELASLKKQLAALGKAKRPQTGSYFLYDLVEVRESQGQDGQVASRLQAYYRKVNEHNKAAFADKMPRPVEEGESSYVGIEVCSNCHLEERAVWDKTGHAGAYDTLTSQHKEFNLDCVSCHVTGYEKPGGSTVTHVEKLTDVQCEVCHGPGSRHVENPAGKGLIRPAPLQSFCGSACHHPPHVGKNWRVEDAWPKILGPGHGFGK